MFRPLAGAFENNCRPRASRLSRGVPSQCPIVQLDAEALGLRPAFVWVPTKVVWRARVGGRGSVPGEEDFARCAAWERWGVAQNWWWIN